MTASRTILKIIGIITIFSAVLQIILGGFLMAGSGLIAGETVSAGTQTIDASTGAMVMGAIVVIASVVELIVGIFALRGAKDPAKVGAFKVVAIIGFVLCFAQMLMFAVTGQIASFGISGWVQLAMLAFCVFLAFKVSGQRNA